MRRPKLRVGRPTPKDAVAGFVTGLFSIPEGMAYASIGGFNPVLGLYSGMVPTTVGSLFSRTVLMTTTLTSAIALTSQSVLSSAGLDPDDLDNVATLTVLVGAIMVVFGLLRLGSVMSFVSNAVMTGFTSGIALQIVAGVLGDATGYETDAHNTIAKVVDSFAHVADWEVTTLLVALGTVAVWVAVRLVPRLEPFAILAALVVVTVVVVVFSIDVRDVGDIGQVPSGLPHPILPDPGVMPDLLAGAVAVALVALAQAAGIGAAVPNPDGSRTNLSGDFTAQGLANLAGGFFRALPTGGSLSRTGVATSAGARTRWAGIFAGVFLALVVLVAGGVAELIPMPVIGGLVIVIGAELVVGRLPDIRLVLHTGLLPAAAMLATFLATTELPLQQAILLGAGLSLLLFCVSAERSGRLRALVREDGRWRATAVPAELPSDAVTVLHHEGAGLFAEVTRLEEVWPRSADARNAVVILHARAVPDIPSSTVLKSLRRRARQLDDHGCRLMVVGIDPEQAELLSRTGLADDLGTDNIVQQAPVFFEALDAAYDDATRWVEDRRGEGPS
ncbi:SulP family inorganic anion transporter [Nocardioides sp. YIM 152315]|uniref:SulP family inorganic anion transporter n=1 Tax=Nocardioides sp. YIM 152315 TaxID=3031760 RepID=UPI0023DCA742|nr:SulP family inorganic anion transporter [Nocardioides sp. YIM 152315]MDF1605054.1 SulP family inorganic anion transporter [Nocardioides sp. YIM 152315]